MANRYTQLTASEYKPLSMQEMAIAPAMLRQKHDEALAKQQEMSLGLNAYSNPLNQHLERSRQLQNELNSSIDQQAEALARDGYSRNSASDLISLNRRYQNLISPTGELGQINAAKEAYYKNREEFMKSADSQKRSRASAERAWAEHVSKYTGYDANGNISQIGTLGAAEKYTPMDYAKDAKALVGKILQETAGGGNSIKEGPDGSYVVTNTTGSILKSSNVDQLNALLKEGIMEFGTPGRKGFLSEAFDGVSPQQSISALKSYFDGMLNIENRNTVRQNVSLSGVRNRKDAEDANRFGTVEGGSFHSSLGPEFKNSKTLNQARNSLIAKKNSKEGLTQDEMFKLMEYDKQLKSMRDNLKSDGLYSEYEKKVKDANKQAGLDPDFKREDLKVEEKMEYSDGVMIPVGKTYFYKGEEISLSKYNEISKKANEAYKITKNPQSKMNEIETSYLNKSNQIQMTMLETTEKSEKVAKAMERNLHTVLKDKNILTNNRNIEVQSIHSSSEKESKEIGSSRKEKFGKDFYELMSSVDPNDVTARQIGFGKDGIYLKVSVKTDNKSSKREVVGQTVKPGETLDVMFKVKSTDGNYAISNPFSSVIRLHTKGNMAALNTNYGGDGFTQNYDIGKDVTSQTFKQNAYNSTWGVKGVSDVNAVVNDLDMREKLMQTINFLNIPEPTNIEDLQEVIQYLNQNNIKVGR